MKAILLLAESFPELTSFAPSRPSYLIQVADRPILAHMVTHMLEKGAEAVTVVVPTAEKTAVESWLAESLPGESVTVQAVSESMAAMKALQELGDSLLVQGPVVLLSNQAITMYDDWADLPDGTVESATLFGKEAIWLRDGQAGMPRLIQAGAESLSDAVRQSGLDYGEIRPLRYLEIMTMNQVLHASKRLLGNGFSSNDALERSYTEEFGVIPPVFIHRDAEIYSAMIGPYVSIGAGAVVENTVLRDTIIESGASVSDQVLVDTIVGQNSILQGEPTTTIVPENSEESASAD